MKGGTSSIGVSNAARSSCSRHPVHLKRKVRSPYDGAQMLTGSSGFLQIAAGQIGLMAAIGLVFIAMAWKYVC
jgi:hypothetical protein